MLHIAKHSDKCCCTCSHWNGVRVQEDDGHVYALRQVEAVCKKLWDWSDFSQTGMPLTLPSNSACQEWDRWHGVVESPVLWTY